MHAIAREKLWIVDLAALALCAALLGRAASVAIDLRLLRSRPSAASSLPRQALLSPGPSSGHEVIIDRNIFCSSCPAVVALNPEGQGRGKEPLRSQLALDLLAVNQVVSRTRRSDFTAVLRDRVSKAVGAFAAGELVRGALILRIDEMRVYLLNGGREEFLDLLGAEATTTTAPAESSGQDAGSPTGSANGTSHELERGIRKVGERAYVIQRSTLENLLGNVNSLARSARIMPEIRDGRAAGFRLHSVLPQGPFAKIGMQNGDVIVSINGLELTSPEQGFEVYGKLKSASHLGLELERGGKRMVIEYSIR
jgi:general secretion pathway protein C